MNMNEIKTPALDKLLEVQDQMDFKIILYLIFDYPHKHYTFKYFEV